MSFFQRMKLRWEYRSDFKEYCKERDLEHKRKAPITGNLLWYQFLEDNGIEVF